MPKLADTLVEGTLGQWLKDVGDSVSQGEPLASIETDKVTTELTSPAAGTLLEMLVAEGETVPVETPIARIGELSSTTASPDAASAAAPTPTEAATRRKATPIAARLLEEHGLTAHEVPTRSARLTRDDVLTFIQSRARVTSDSSVTLPSAPPSDLIPLTSMRRAIADHMLKSHRTIPHGQTVMDADLTQLVAWREATRGRFQEAEGASLTFTVLFVRALARRLSELVEPPVDVGVAVALDAGLIVPVLRQADQLTLSAIARGIAHLAGRARANQLKPDETQGARMTVTNVGSFGNLIASPIIPVGQLGILGPGLVEPRPMPSRPFEADSAGAGIRQGWRCLLSLVFDRRALDDFDADRFLRGVVDELTRIPVDESH
jgi:pyruvate/2-oxoglutarate dehydrogenase complex dihydrolipoamide acyltransferase (E2) component